MVIGMGTWFMLDFVRGNRASGATIAITVGVSSFLLALLGGVLFNFWSDAAAQAAADGVDWQERLTGELSATAALYVFVLVLACIALVLIIRNAFAASMHSRVHQLGILATVGATPRQIRTLLLREALLLSLFPALVGIGLGIAASGLFVSFAIEFGQQVGVAAKAPLEFRYHPLVLLATVVMVLATVIISAGLPARRLAKAGPLAAVAGATETTDGKPFRSSRFASLLGVEGELAYNSIRQRRAALRSTAVSMGLAFFVLSVFLSFMTVSRMSVEQTYYQRYGTTWDMVVESPVASPDDMRALAEGMGDALEESMVDASDRGMRLYLKMDAGRPAEARSAIEDTVSVSGDYELTVVDMREDKKRSDAIWDGYVMVVGGFCGILAFIGVAAIMTQSIGFIRQRRREFARLRSIGMTPGGIVKMLGIEGVITVLRPLAISLPFIVASGLGLAFLGRQPLPDFLAQFPFGLMLAYLGIIFALVLSADAIGAIRVVRINLPEALKNDVLL